MEHGHYHGHHDHHHGNNNRRVLVVSLVVAVVFMVVEVVGGILSNSLALLSDAGHMFGDSLSLWVSLLALSFSAKAPDDKRSFGYGRFEILAAAFNGGALLVIAVLIVVEAVERLFVVPNIESGQMLVISALGLGVNLFQAWYMHRGGDHDNLNMRSAYLHVLSDLLGSVAAIVAAVLMLLFGWLWADTVASVLVALLIVRSGWRVTVSAWHVLMEGVPEGVAFDDVAQAVAAVPGVNNVHDLHVWSLTSGRNVMSCHVKVSGDLRVADAERLVRLIEKEVRALSVHHVTVQVESDEVGHGAELICVEWGNDEDLHHHGGHHH